MGKKSKSLDPDDIPSVRRARELYVKGMRELMAKQGVSSIDELEMSPEARRLQSVVSPFWNEPLRSD
jgi:hypothetical protein